MGRPRLESKSHLPENVYSDPSGYLTYRDQITAKRIGLGHDVESAISLVKPLNIDNKNKKNAALNQKIAVAKSRGAVDKSGLVQLQFLRENAESFDRVCGIYFLMLDGEVVYIGQSTNCHGRIAGHQQQDHKEFDACYVIKTDQSSLTVLENLYINKFKPAHNKSTPAPAKKTAWGILQRHTIG